MQGHDAQRVAHDAESGNDAHNVSADEAVPPDIFSPCKNIADMHFNHGQPDPGQAVGQSKTCVGVCASIENDAGYALFFRQFESIDKRAFHVALVKSEPYFCGVSAEEIGYKARYDVKPLITVDVGLALAQMPQVGAVEHQDVKWRAGEDVFVHKRRGEAMATRAAFG